MKIKCRNCGCEILKINGGVKLLNSIVVIDMNMVTGETEYGIMCTNCGRYVPKKQIAKVVEVVKRGGVA